MVLALSACSLFGPSGSAPADDPTPGKKQTPADVQKVIKTLKPLAQKDKAPSAKDFFQTMTAAGYKKSALEATIDATPLDTGIPAKMFGVRVSGGCVIGEIRGGKVEAKKVPRTKSTGTCLVGDVQRPAGVATPSGEPRGSEQTGPDELLPGDG